MDKDFAVHVLVENLYDSAHDIDKELIHEAMKFLVEDSDCIITRKDYIDGEEFTYYKEDLCVIHEEKAKLNALEFAGDFIEMLKKENKK